MADTTLCKRLTRLRRREHSAVNRRVVGSIPTASTIKSITCSRSFGMDFAELRRIYPRPLRNRIVIDAVLRSMARTSIESGHGAPGHGKGRDICYVSIEINRLRA